MIKLRDVDNDIVCGRVQKQGTFSRGDAYVIDHGRSGEVPFARFDASMARTLAADLIAFADSQQQETENEG